MSMLIVIPARFASTRLPGKPLVMIAGKTMIQRTFEVAQAVQAEIKGLRIVIATEDSRVAEHAKSFGAEVCLTSENCPTGTDRAFEVASTLSDKPDIILNLQGDAPLTPPHILKDMLLHMQAHPEHSVVTPVTRLSWEGLDALREAKKTSPFSGTTAIRGEQGKALWFSKQIIPAIRGEEKLRKAADMSPVYRHIGLYGFRYNALERFVSHEMTPYETLESLEQLRLLEMGIDIHTVDVDYHGLPSMQGIDTEEDRCFAESLLLEHKEVCS